MHSQEHSTIREGLVTGLLGAAAVAVWYLVVDAAAGRPFYTPNALGGVLFRGDASPGAREVVPALVAGFTLVHLIVLAVIGVVLTQVVHLASRNLALRMGLWIGLVVSFCLTTGLTYMLTTATGEAFPLWSVIGGALVAVLVMGWYLWRRHPRLGSDAPLGAEVRTTPHAPGPPRR
jgi:hypothetical protein